MVLLNIVVPLNRNIIHDRYTPNSARRHVKGLLYSTHIHHSQKNLVLLDFSLTVKSATLIFISGCCLAISSA